MIFSRANPSARYRELQSMYRELHEGGENLGSPPAKTIKGLSLMSQSVHIKSLIERTGSRTVLDSPTRHAGPELCGKPGCSRRL